MQRLLRVLATGRDVAELGTAFGEGAAAMAATARTVLTVEADPPRAAAARERLLACSNVELVEGDWREVLAGRGPFGLVFADARPYDWEAILGLLAPGSLLVKDDLITGAPVEGDPVREFLLRDPRLVATEVSTTAETAAVIASRLPPEAARGNLRAEGS